jgi:hypothetical protein
MKPRQDNPEAPPPPWTEGLDEATGLGHSAHGDEASGLSFGPMTKTVWLTTVGTDPKVTKTDPMSIGLNVEVTVRAGEGVLLDGVWLNRERSYDT